METNRTVTILKKVRFFAAVTMLGVVVTGAFGLGDVTQLFSGLGIAGLAAVIMKFAHFTV